MYTAGSILYFTPFFFKNGNTPKNKYFIVLGGSGDDLIVASLPTSKDHTPNYLPKKHGCIEDATSNFNCYYFEKGVVISECNTFAFPLDTYIYGEQVDVMSKSLLSSRYQIENKDYIKLSNLSAKEFDLIRACLINSASVKRKIKRYLTM
ncbi:hypothetical protein [Candidatus Symbiothrix dinenymphae]|uniref:hypothetical protein n=1 Tax=Candidatus Symbiothrix dinenymphae TaxID=467085 RepID=UPI0006BFD032|nr:hypothetical protein [Candidatus Symbiothrix dinenymphae]GAP72210.1 hypothetical protein SAMD00024442_27_20 [Candidatus Symbiothrix dinenymphae]